MHEENNMTFALPSISSARLPATYEAACTALSECTRLDECQTWADKAEAMASYARQSKDDSLRKMADRIQARAIRRCGELLKQIPDENRGRRNHEGTHRNLTRSQAAANGGLSEHQKVTALRVASVPEQQFTEAVESEDPPTVTELADRGKQPRPTPIVDLGDIPPADFARATEAGGTLRRFAEFCSAYDAERIAKAFKPHEIPALREHVSVVDAWLDKFVINL
jgi:hypothetical protein